MEAYETATFAEMPDQLLPQPPPNTPAPPAGEEALRSQSKMLWIVIGGICFVLAGMLTLPMTIRSRKNTNQTEAVNNMRQVGVTLLEFQAEYGRFPDNSSGPDVASKTGSTLSFGHATSNDLFKQLLAANRSGGEAMFYAKAALSLKPDNIWTSDAEALKHGECAFVYICGIDPKGDPRTPVAFGP